MAFAGTIAGCAKGGGGQQAAPAASTAIDSVQGIVGINPLPPHQVLIQPSTGASVQIAGQFAVEVGHLTGAVVIAYGRREAGSPWPVLTAARYRLVSVGGQTPLVGIIRLAGNRVLLDVAESTDVLELAHVPIQLARAGLKVYVIGRRIGTTLEVEQFGVIREPRP